MIDYIQGVLKMSQRKEYDKQFKIDTVDYIRNHPEMTIKEISEKLGISMSNLNRWKSQLSQSETASDAFRGSGNYANDVEKEAARLRRENKDLKDALEVLKKAIGILGN
jgi:transposase